MSNKYDYNSPDPAAVFASALSLWQACHKEVAAKPALNLSQCYNGGDQFMRELMRVGSEFEDWSNKHICFDKLNDVWPYLLEDKFGKACLDAVGIECLAGFDNRDCLRVALDLRLPIKIDDFLPVPVNLTAKIPNIDGFRELRIQTMRNLLEADQIVPFVAGDDPFDDEFSDRFFSLYGINSDGTMEHIADRRSYTGAFDLARKLAPGVAFPSSPVFCETYLQTETTT